MLQQCLWIKSSPLPRVLGISLQSRGSGSTVSAQPSSSSCPQKHILSRTDWRMLADSSTTSNWSKTIHRFRNSKSFGGDKPSRSFTPNRIGRGECAVWNRDVCDSASVRKDTMFKIRDQLVFNPPFEKRKYNQFRWRQWPEKSRNFLSY